MEIMARLQKLPLSESGWDAHALLRDGLGPVLLPLGSGQLVECACALSDGMHPFGLRGWALSSRGQALYDGHLASRLQLPFSGKIVFQGAWCGIYAVVFCSPSSCGSELSGLRLGCLACSENWAFSDGAATPRPLLVAGHMKFEEILARYTAKSNRFYVFSGRGFLGFRHLEGLGDV